MFLKTLLLLLLLPPVNLVLVNLVGLVWLRRFPRFSRWLIGGSAALLLALAMPGVASVLLDPLEAGLPMRPPAGRPPGAIVILGGDIDHIRDANPDITVGPLTLQRLRAGATLERSTHLPILVSGGQIGAAAPPIADLMQQSLVQDFRVPVRWVEDRSRNTWQNAHDSAAILRANGITSIYLVTNAWHERRALIAFASTGVTATAAPVPLDHRASPIPSDFMPTATAWLTSYYAMHEWLGCLWYSLP